MQKLDSKGFIVLVLAGIPVFLIFLREKLPALIVWPVSIICLVLLYYYIRNMIRRERK
jgi:hypothetical protein